MKRAGLEVTMRQLDPNKCASMKEYIDKLQIMHQKIMHAGKQISSEDMAILLLSKLTNKYGAFYSSLITSGRMTELLWEELVPMVLDQEDRFKATATKSDSTTLTSQAKPLELAHMDLCGPMQTVSLGGSLYFMLLVDDFSSYVGFSFFIRRMRIFLASLLG